MEYDIFQLLFVLFLTLFFIVTFWKIYVKAGVHGWAIFIPIYSDIKRFNIGGKSGWYLLAMLVPIWNIIVAIQVVHGTSTRFGKGTGFTLGLIFLPFIFYPILAFGDAKYSV